MGFIYCYENIKDGTGYTGQTKRTVQVRDREHHNKLQSHFDYEVHAHPNDWIISNIIECDDCLLNIMEQYYIFNNQTKWPLGYNHDDGGSAGGLSEIVKQTLSELNSGEKHPQYGIPSSEEKKRKISNTLKGHKVSEEERLKIAETLGAKKILCVKTNAIYFGGAHAERETGVCKNNIIACCNGRRKMAGGSEWKYID